MRVHILPMFNQPDNGDGGIRRIVEAQKRHLPNHDIEVVDEGPYDMVVVHAGDWPRDGVAVDMPVAAHCHGLYWNEYEWSAGAVAVNNAVVHNLLRADAVSVCSQFVARAIRKALWIDPAVIYHGVEEDEWLGLPRAQASGAAEGYILWNKARVDPICNPTPVLHLAKLLPDVPFVTTFLPKGATPLGNVVVTGRVPYQQSQVMTNSAGVYLGTTRGTFDISVVEAMICGVPVLGWNWGSLPEAVMHRVHGYLAEPGDYADLANGYRYIMQNREMLSRACVEQVHNRFTWSRIVGEYADMYKATAAAAAVQYAR